MNNIKQDIQTILSAFKTVCNKFGAGMPEKFYEKQMKKALLQIKTQPSYKMGTRYRALRPDARYKDVVIEYKSSHCPLEAYLYRKTQYLKHCDCAVVIIWDFEKRQDYQYY